MKKVKLEQLVFSNYTIKHLIPLISLCKYIPTVNQVEYHPLLNQEDLLDFCNKNNIFLQSYSTLGKGKILNNQIIENISKNYNKSSAQICLKWTLQKGIGVIPKSSNENRIKENIDIFDFEISEEDMKKLDDLNEDWHCTWNPTTVP